MSAAHSPAWLARLTGYRRVGDLVIFRVLALTYLRVDECWTVRVFGALVCHGGES